MLGPGSTIGILGGGQLGRMLSIAAANLGFKVHVFAPPGDNPAFEVSGQATAASYSDEEAIKSFAAACDVVTLEFENIPLATAKWISSAGKLHPGPKALEISQDRLNEKKFFNGIGLKTAPFWDIQNAADLGEAIISAGGAGILKTRRMGYDGKGQIRLKGHQVTDEALGLVQQSETILEGFIPFSKEISIIAARSTSGEKAYYPCPLNVHESGILRSSTLSREPDYDLEDKAREAAGKVLDELSYVGVMAIEFFVLSGDTLLVNEMAPRVHNSGHWTDKGAQTSQFEQHIRAITGWPLGSCAPLGAVRMENLLGDEIQKVGELAEQGGHVTLYGKKEAREGRKMGHVTWLNPT